MKKLLSVIASLLSTVFFVSAQEIDSLWLDFLNASDSMYVEGLDTIYVVDNSGGSGGGGGGE